MKLLVVFLLLCALLLAFTAWQLVGALGRQPAAPRLAERLAPAEPQPVQLAADELAEPVAVPAESADLSPPALATPATDPPPEAPTPDEAVAEPPEVRWPEDPELRAAQRRLTAARVVLRDDPDHERARRDELDALARLERWDEALASVRELRRLHPDDTALAFEEAALLMQLGRALDAVGVLNLIVHAQPADARAWFNLAVAHQELGHLSAARHAWDRTIALVPTTEARAQRGVILSTLGDWAAAVNDFEQVLLDEPDAADATINLAIALRHLGRSDEARTRLVALVEQRPRHLPALRLLAEIAWDAWQAAPRDDARRREVALWCARALEVDGRQASLRAWLDAAGGGR